MIILQIRDLEKSFGIYTVFHQVNAVLQSRDKIALMGVNGSGKSTLLRCILGELEADKGTVAIASGVKIGYLQQFQTELQGKTLWETALQSFEELLHLRARLQELELEIASASTQMDKLLEQYARLAENYERQGGYLCETQARKILLGLGFNEEDFSILAENLSGGQKTRLRLACTLIQNPEVLLLDEPTNHLDIQAVEWLEGYLRAYEGTLLFISHDRRMVEQVATGVWEMHRGHLDCYAGNYTAYLQQRDFRNLTQQRAWEKQQTYIHKTEEYIRMYKAGIKSKQARGRASVLSRLERIEAPQEEKKIRLQQMEIHQESGQEVLIAEGISKTYRDGHPVLQNLELHIRKGEKVALIGANGCGKSTLLKILAGRLAADTGTVRIGSRVEIAWFSQEFEGLHEDWTLFQEISRNFSLDDVEVRSCLGSMLFSEEEVFKTIGTLSGGEKGRLALLKLLLSGANFLLLDEPTNHLDMESREIMEHILQAYSGTLLLVSHDRYFIDQIAERILAFEPEGLVSFGGNYSYYKEKKEQQAQERTAIQSKQLPNRSGGGKAAREREEQKQQQRIIRRLEQRSLQLETEISALEAEKATYEQQLSAPEGLQAADYQQLVQSYEAVTSVLEQRMEEWTEVQIELEDNQK